MGMKDFFIKKAIKKQLKSLPDSQKKIFETLFEENPGLFEKISMEIRDRKKRGQDELLASASVMKQYEGKIREILMRKK